MSGNQHRGGLQDGVIARIRCTWRAPISGCNGRSYP
jgi:hypothetical protein